MRVKFYRAVIASAFEAKHKTMNTAIQKISAHAAEMQSFPVSLYLKSMPVFAARALRYADGTFRLGSMGALFHRKLTNREIERVECSFKAVLKGELFTDLEFTAVWRKVDEHAGECAASDGGFVTGELHRFGLDEKVSIELMEAAA